MGAKNLILLGSIGLLALWVFKKDQDLGGGLTNIALIPPSTITADSPPPGSYPDLVGYPGIKVSSSSGGSSRGGGYSSYSNYIAAKINPRGLPADVATNPARLIKDVLPGGSGGVIQGLIQYSQQKAGISQSSNMLRIAQPGATKADIARKTSAVLGRIGYPGY